MPVSDASTGASYGAALLAAQLQHEVRIDDWNPPAGICTPDTSLAAQYDDPFRLYLDLYPASREIVHALAAQVNCHNT